jgi:hypothetical protein
MKRLSPYAFAFVWLFVLVPSEQIQLVFGCLFQILCIICGIVLFAKISKQNIKSVLVRFACGCMGSACMSAYAGTSRAWPRLRSICTRSDLN